MILPHHSVQEQLANLAAVLVFVRRIYCARRAPQMAVRSHMIGALPFVTRQRELDQIIH